MKAFILVVLAIAPWVVLSTPEAAPDQGPGIESGSLPTLGDTLWKGCSFKGIDLHGKVQLVEVFPDIRVQLVEVFPDIRVKWVPTFPDDCGEWQEVDVFPDFTIQIVDAFPDVKVRIVESFPGIEGEEK